MEPWPRPASGSWHYLRFEERRQQGGAKIRGFSWFQITGFDHRKRPHDEDLLTIFCTTHQVALTGSNLDYLVEELSHQRLKLIRVGKSKEGSREVSISAIDICTNAEMDELARQAKDEADEEARRLRS